jgi:hypothetical protein
VQIIIAFTPTNVQISVVLANSTLEANPNATNGTTAATTNSEASAFNSASPSLAARSAPATGTELTETQVVALETLALRNVETRVLAAVPAPTPQPITTVTLPGRDILPTANLSLSAVGLQSAATAQSGGGNDVIPEDLEDLLLEPLLPEITTQAPAAPAPKQEESAPPTNPNPKPQAEVAEPLPLLHRAVDACFTAERSSDGTLEEPQRTLTVPAETEAPVSDWSFGRVSLAVLLAGYAGLHLRDADDRSRRTSI